MATDGDAQAVQRLNTSLKHNCNLRADNIAFGVYSWGEPFKDTILGDELKQGDFDIILGADVVSDARQYVQK